MQTTQMIINTAAESEFLLHNLEQAVKVIGLYVNSDKIEMICLNEDRVKFLLNGKPLKLYQFI